MLDFSRFDSLVSLVSFFDTDITCRKYLAEARWGDDVVCPYCGAHHCYSCEDGRFSCPNRECKRAFNVTVGTIFENSKLPLTKWFVAIYLNSSNKKGVSSCQLARDLSITQKSAWNVLQKIRSLFVQNDSVVIDGDVEMDEAYLGGDNKWRHETKKIPNGQGGANKTPIFGMICRENGNVVALKVNNTKRDTIFPLISQFVSDKDTVLFTDESVIYKNLHSACGFPHYACNHSEGNFSDGNGVHTNNIEGFWSHFKGMVRGTYHHVSVVYLQRYIDEMCFRWNTRNESEGDRFKFIFGACVGRFTYKDVRLSNIA